MPRPRPPRPPQTEQLNVRLTPDELARINRVAELTSNAFGMSKNRTVLLAIEEGLTSLEILAARKVR